MDIKEQIRKLKFNVKSGQLKLNEVLETIEKLEIDQKKKDSLLKSIKRIQAQQKTIEGQLSFDFDAVKEKKVKCSLHLERQKQGTSEANFQKILVKLRKDDLVPSNLPLTPQNLGLDLTLRQQYALFAVQRIIADFQFTPRVSGGYVCNVGDYLQYFGCTPIKGNRIGGHERRDAMQALMELSEKKVWVYYESIPDKRGKRDIEVYYEPILLLGAAFLSQSERIDLGANKLAFKPCKVFFDEIKKYHVLKPVDYLQKIKSSLGRRGSKYIPAMIDLLFYQREQKKRNNEPLEVRVTTISLGTALRMFSMIEKREWQKIQIIIEDASKIAILENWLSGYKYNSESDLHIFNFTENLAIEN